MAAAEGTETILHRGKGSPLRHPVVDRHGGAERDVGIGPHIRDVTPLANAGEGRGIGPNQGLLAIVFRVSMETLAEEERATGAVGDVRNTQAAVNEEDAVPGHAGRMNRPFAGVAAITGHPIET